MSGPRNDGRMEINISEDKMTVTLDLYPPVGGGQYLDPGYIDTLLDGHGICYGINNDPLLDALTKHRDNHEVKGVVIARGTPPVDEVAEYFKVKRKFFEPHTQLPPNEKENIDYKMISPFVLVAKGELMAIKKEGREGVPGTNVFGDEIPYGKKSVKTIEPGEHTEYRDGGIYSQIAGCFEMNGNKLQVNETLVIKQNIDYSTGHVSFGGDVVIFGTIKDGFRVAAGGNVYCKKTLDASQVLSKKDLLVEGGIIGRKKAVVRIHGHIETRFIESCDVESLSGISVKTSIFHSPVYTRGPLEMGKKGTIVDSIVYAEKGIDCAFIGREGSPPSKVYCGLSFVADRKLKHIQNQLVRLKKDSTRVGSLPQTEKNKDLARKLTLAIERMERHKRRFSKELYTAPEAEVRVHNAVYPGTLVTICGSEYHVTEKMTRIRFFFDKEKKCISSAPL